MFSILWENNNYCEHPPHTHTQAYHKQHDVMITVTVAVDSHMADCNKFIFLIKKSRE